MKLAGDYTLDAPRELVWKALLDPDVLSKTLPGCEDLKEVGENQYEGRLKMKVGPVQGVFEGKVQLSNLDPPNSYDITIDGKGAPGFMNGNGTLTLAEDVGGTKLTYAIDAQVGGRIASIGQRLVESSAKVITKQGLKGLDKQIQELKAAEAAPAERAETAPQEAPTTKLDMDQVLAAKAETGAEGEVPEHVEHVPFSGEHPATEHGAGRPRTAEPQGDGHFTATPRHSGRGFPIGVALILLTIAAIFIYLRGCT